jgi:hypothetical protein
MKKYLPVVCLSFLTACGGGGGGGGGSKSSSVNTSVSSNSSFVMNPSSTTGSSTGANNSSFVMTLSSVANTSSAASAPAGSRYIPLEVKSVTAPDILLVNTANTQASVTLATDVTNGFITIPSADYNATTGTLTNVRPAYVVYAKEGKLFKAFLQSGAAPVAVQLSNETQVATNCPFNGSSQVLLPNILTSFPDLQATSSVIFYKAVSGNGCVNKAVILSMNATDSPIDLSMQIALAPFEDPVTGYTAGFFVRQGIFFGITDTQLQNFTFLATITNDVQITNGSPKSAIVTLDGAIRRFDFATKQLSNPIVTYPEGSIVVGLADATAYYWTAPQLGQLGNATGNISLYKLTDTASPVLSTLYTTSQAATMLSGLTTSKVILSENAISNHVTVAKTGGAATAINIPNGASVFGTNGERVYYVLVNPLSVHQSMLGSIVSNNTGVMEFGSAIPVGAFGSALSLYDSSQINYYIIGEYANDRSTLAKATLSLIDGVTGQKTSILGNLPDIGFNNFRSDSFRSGVLGFCVSTALTCDGFYHTEAASSLVRVTNFLQ